MTPEQALQILYKAARAALMNGDNHDHIQRAAEVLAELVKRLAGKGAVAEVERVRE